MTQAQLPPELQYGIFRPKGYYTQFKQWPITPMSSNQFWTPEEIVRFLITIKSGVMDPYRSHIEFLVTVPLQMCPVGGMQVDNSAQSFISQTVISSNNAEIQRITQYDTLAAYLSDIGFSQYVCQSRQAQGLGYTAIGTNDPYAAHFPRMSQYQVFNGNVGVTQNGTNFTMPSRVPTQIGLGPSVVTTSGGSDVTNFTTNSYSTVVPSIENIIWQPPKEYGIDGILNSYGRLNNVRSQYAMSIYDNNYPDTTRSILLGAPRVLNQTYNSSTMTQNLPNSGYNPKNPYQIDWNTAYNTSLVQTSTGNSVYPVTLPLNTPLYGFQRPYASQFCKGANQPLLSPTIPQCQMQNGMLLNKKVPVSSQLFRLPLISSICGVLIPPDQFLLIPIKALYNLLLEVTLSRYAMFTTGYCDVHEVDIRGMQNMQPRKWIISQIVWNLHLYTFADQQVNRTIQASLVKSIPVSATSYALASQFQLPNGMTVRNSWPIATQAQSLCEIICLFLSNQYSLYTFCRKQFRLSNCISSMQVKFNTDYYPSQPIIGNAGNPCILDTTGDAWPFYENILLSSNFLFNTNLPTPRINMKNFCINQRCYNVTKTTPMYDPAMKQNFGYKFTNQSVNLDTAMGYPYFHENRYIGKAAFVYCWEPYGHSKTYMTGINTQGVQNFSVIFNTISTNPYPEDETLLIFTRQNIVVIYSNDGIKVLGK